MTQGLHVADWYSMLDSMNLGLVGRSELGTGSAINWGGMRMSYRQALARALVYVIPAASMLLYFSFVARRAAIDTDEPYYILGGTLVSFGKLPYADFFFPQTPLSAYVFGTWQRLFGYGIASVRFLGCILATATGLLTFHAVRRELGLRSGCLALLYFCLSWHLTLWLVRAKTYGLAAFLSTLALVLVTSRRLSVARAFAAGLFAGLAVSARLLFLPLPLLLVLYLPMRGDASERSRRVVSAVTGVLIGVLPCVLLWIMAHDAFLFDNVRYHALRGGGNRMFGDWQQKFTLLRALIGGQETTWGPQCMLLFPAALAGLYGAWRGNPCFVLYPATVLTLFVTFLLPTPSWDQYFAAITPAAIVSFVLMFTGPRAPTQAVAWVFLVPYALAYWFPFEATYVRAAPPFEPRVADDVGRAISDLTKPGEVVAAKSAFLLPASGRVPHRCGFNTFAFGDWKRLDPIARAKYQLCTDEMLTRAIVDGEVSVYAAASPDELGLQSALLSKGWKSTTVHSVTLWRSP